MGVKVNRDPRLTFLVDFVNADISQLDESQWEQLTKDFQRFIEDTPRMVDEMDETTRWGIKASLQKELDPAERTLSHEVMGDIQKATKKILEQVLDESSEVVGTDAISIRESRSLWFPRPHVRYLWIEGTPRELFFSILQLLIVRGADTQLRKCPECGTFFIRIRKQQYCSRACTKRAVMRDWRQTPKGKAAQARSSRIQYEKRLQKSKKA